MSTWQNSTENPSQIGVHFVIVHFTVMDGSEAGGDLVSI